MLPTPFSYFGIFFGLILAGSIIPFPEEVILLSLGYSASAGYLNTFFALCAAMFGVIVGDSILFALARHGGEYVDRLYARLTRSRAGKFISNSDSFPGYWVVVSRFLVGVRTLGPFIAVNQGMSWFRFLLWDISAVVLFVPLWFFAGYYFHSAFSEFVNGFVTIQHVAFLSVLVGVSALAWWVVRGKKTL